MSVQSRVPNPPEPAIAYPKRSPVGASPGTLIADPDARRSALSLTLIRPDRCDMQERASLADVEAARRAWPLVWVDVVGLADIDLIRALGEMFGLHPLALEDTVNTGQRPKVDFYDDHAYMVMSMLDAPAIGRYEQISIFFGADFVITLQEREGDPFEPVRRRLSVEGTSRIRARKGDYLAYALIDAVVDSFFAPLDAASERIDGIEDAMLGQPQKGHVRELHQLRRTTATLKRAVLPLRDAIAGLIRTDVPFITAETRTYFNDALDHTIRLIDLGETQRDMLTGLIELHLSLSQARTNEVISFLTVISSIFIPLTFLVGVWGMNFDPASSPFNMPELESYYGYPLSLGFMLLVAVSLIGYFRWKKWL